MVNINLQPLMLAPTFLTLFTQFNVLHQQGLYKVNK